MYENNMLAFNRTIQNSNVLSATFPVLFTENSNIVANYSKQSSALYSYSVFFNDRKIFNSLPFFQSVSNPCTSATSCTFSIKLIKLSTSPNSCSYYVYFNGIAVISNEIMTSTSSDRSINFNVTTGNNIQVYYYYRYGGGPFPYSYSLYSQADAAGSPYFTSVNTETSPKTIASIPNFCGVTNLALSIKKSVYDSSSNQISISVVPSFLSSIPFPVQLNLTCSTGTTSQT